LLLIHVTSSLDNDFYAVAGRRWVSASVWRTPSGPGGHRRADGHYWAGHGGPRFDGCAPERM